MGLASLDVAAPTSPGHPNTQLAFFFHHPLSDGEHPPPATSPPRRSYLARFSQVSPIRSLCWPEAKPQLHPGTVEFRDGRLVGRTGPAHATLDVPPDGLIEMRVRMSPGAQLTLTFRFDEESGRGYSFALKPAQEEVVTEGQGVHWVRAGCRLDTSKPLLLRAFLTGSIIEFFVNDQYAFTRRAYELPAGKLAFRIDAGEVAVEGLTVKAVE